MSAVTKSNSVDSLGVLLTVGSGVGCLVVGRNDGFDVGLSSIRKFWQDQD